MLERCVVGGPGFLKFKLSGTWIAKSIHKMLMYAKEMCMDHLRSTILAETLVRMLKYSRVGVRRRFHCGDHLDIKSKMMMTEFLFDRFLNGEVNNYQATGEHEVSTIT
ncbi:arginine--tRNA ligase, chloroplastic/mitochondrial-like protein isoform X2 [Tanacetum coccineum]